jgi:transcriptional regulator with XRE-family HTH domain
VTSATQTAAAHVVPDWTLGWRLQRALAHAEVSVEDMAGELGVTRSTISRWMHDRGAPPRPIYVKQWALRTGVSQEWLLSGSSPTIGWYSRNRSLRIVDEPQVSEPEHAAPRVATLDQQAPETGDRTRPDAA